jgi:lipopolysaccharide transport system permease protein
MADGVEYIIDSRNKRGIDWAELWQYRELFFFFTWRDVKVKYKQTVLGIIWVVLQPILAVAIFSLFFGHALNVKPSGMPYPLFAFSGLLLWSIFSGSVNNGGNSMITQAPIIKKIYFPRVIIPVSAVLVSLIDFVVAFVVFLLVIPFFDVDVDWVLFIICTPLALLLTIIATLGVTSLLAALTVKYKDFRHVIPFGLQIALFVTPVIYPTSLIPYDWLRNVLYLNPMYAPISILRMPFAAETADISMLAVSIASSFAGLVIGFLYFRRTESFFADIA